MWGSAWPGHAFSSKPTGSEGRWWIAGEGHAGGHPHWWERLYPKDGRGSLRGRRSRGLPRQPRGPRVGEAQGLSGHHVPRRGPELLGLWRACLSRDAHLEHGLAPADESHETGQARGPRREPRRRPSVGPRRPDLGVARPLGGLVQRLQQAASGCEVCVFRRGRCVGTGPHHVGCCKLRQANVGLLYVPSLGVWPRAAGLRGAPLHRPVLPRARHTGPAPRGLGAGGERRCPCRCVRVAAKADAAVAGRGTGGSGAGIFR
mmetsp:Transcript_113054/g.359216  ORF Transcript_113054/g.359216 Transcript_113054/m.359216 type:complete len:260 (+) Transcript_113054:139-918(+)